MISITDLKVANRKLDELSSDDITQLRTEIIKGIFNIPFMKSAECTICYSVEIIVDVKLPCRNIDSKTGRPRCEGLMCLSCARRILGLSLNRQQYHEVKCPTCRESSRRPLSAIEGYSINMGLIRAIDNYLIFENTIYKNIFGQSLKPIECSKCRMQLDTLSDLHHHLRGDTGYNNCPESLVLCLQCKTLCTRKTLTPTNICEKCYISNQINVWDRPPPQADEVAWIGG